MQRSALILAGGKGTRLGEREKALLIHKGRTLLEKAIDILGPVVDEVIVSVRDQRQQEAFSGYVRGVRLLCDKYQGKGPLAGMLEGMLSASGNYVFVVACDMPFLQPQVIDLLFKEAAGHDAAVPVWKDGRKEPLHAVYNRELLVPAIETSILKGDCHVMAAVSQLHDVRFISMDRIQLMDRGLVSFANINTPADLEQMIKKGAYDYE
ncbi:molybdenum cofactor guanylyltransferase [Methanomethylovorans sp.]|uniref:molybdenum cofactor guanylyltransferase n=1 Tax=Methanomethylovorans sp. TaxID=2758717 RepID=UPI00351C4F6E